MKSLNVPTKFSEAVKDAKEFDLDYEWANRSNEKINISDFCGNVFSPELFGGEQEIWIDIDLSDL